MRQPRLWSLEERNLYMLVTEVKVGGEVVDRYATPFGIRSIRFDAEKGFFLNDKPVKLKGTCNHQDHAGLGAALPDAVQFYRIRKLQEMGCNSLRTSHNPPTPELLEACDRLGMLVFDETRMMSSNPEGMSQFAHLIRRDRNRPSVFMWSMGNEEGQANGDKGVLILSAMKELAEKLDGSRPVSIAPTGAIGTGGLAVCDVVGYNYMDPGAEEFHKAHPERPVIGTETVSAVGTRGIYVTDPAKGYVGSYDPYTTSGRASAEGWWSFCNARPWLAGGFVWTGFDYRGEPSPNGWPNISSQYGIIDTCGFPKDSFYYYQAWWTQKPVLHLFPHWNWPGLEGKEIAVWVYSNLDKVELLVNGKSLGAKDVKKDSHVAWNVTYAPGAIEARGFKDGKLAMTTKRETTGSAAKLVMTADRRGGPRRRTGAAAARPLPPRPRAVARPEAAVRGAVLPPGFRQHRDGEDPRGLGRRRGCGVFCGRGAGCAGARLADDRQPGDFQGYGRGEAGWGGQWRPDRPGIGQGYVAQGVFRALHGDCADDEDGGKDCGGGVFAGACGGECDDRLEGGDAEAAGAGLGATGAGRRGDYRALAAGSGGSGRDRVAGVFCRGREQCFHLPAGWRDADGRCGRDGRRVLWRKRRGDSDSGGQGRGAEHLVQGGHQHIFGEPGGR